MYLAFLPGFQEVFLLIFIILLFFGGKKIPTLMKGLGQGVKEFKKAKKEIVQPNE